MWTNYEFDSWSKLLEMFIFHASFPNKKPIDATTLRLGCSKKASQEGLIKDFSDILLIDENVTLLN